MVTEKLSSPFRDTGLITVWPLGFFIFLFYFILSLYINIKNILEGAAAAVRKNQGRDWGKKILLFDFVYTFQSGSLDTDWESKV